MRSARHEYRLGGILLLAAILAGLTLALLPAAAEEPFVLVPAPGKVVVDGKSGDWDLSGAYGPLTFDPEFLGQSDATFYGMYDKENLYLYLKVHDPTPLINRGIVEEGNYWSGDSLEVRLSLSSEDGVPPPQESRNVRHMSFWYNSERQKAQFKLQATMKYNTMATTGMQVVFRKWDDGTGYDLEAAIPWATMDPTVRPKPGTSVGWCMAILFGNQAGTGFWRKANVLAGDINYQSTSAWFKPGAFFSPVGKVAPNPRTATPPAAAAAEAPPIAKVEYTLPRAGEISLAVYDQAGKMVRTLLCHQPQEAGPQAVPWDGYDDDNKPLAPGQYSWKLAVGDGVRATYLMGALNGGNPKYPTADGKGSWGGIWGNVVDCAADRTGVYLLWSMEEGQGVLVKVNPDGTVLWKQHLPQALSAYQSCLDTNGEYVVVGSGRGLWRVNALTGDYAPFTEKDAYIQLPMTEEWKKLKPEEKVAQVPELARLPFLAFGETHITGLAVQGNRVYISQVLENKVEVYDMATAGKLQEVAVTRPMGLEVDRGKLYVVSGTSVLRFDAQSLAPEGAAISEGLVEPFGLTLDAGGSFWVGDLGSSQQIKRFSPSGKLLTAFGAAGGRPKAGGKFIKTDYLFPTGLCVEPRTGQILFGEDVAPKRVVALDNAGHFLREWVGPYYWGSAGFQVDTAHTPLQLYVFPGTSVIRLNVNLQEQTTEVDAVWPTVEFTDAAGEQVLYYYYRQGKLLYHDGKPYLAICGHDVSLFRVEGYKLIPSAFASTGRFGALDLVGVPKSSAGFGHCTWHDANGNGAVDRDELQTYPQLPAPWPAEYWGPSPNEDFSVISGGTGGLILLPVPGWDAHGNPIYDFNQLKPLTGPLPVAPSDPLPRRGPDGSLYYGAWTYAKPGEQPKGLDWASRITNTGVVKLSPSGQFLWQSLRKAESFRRPAEAYAIQYLDGPFQGCIFADDCSGGQTYVIDGEGLLLGTLMEDVMRGPSPSPYTMYVEHFSSTYFTDPATGYLYMLSGADDIRFFRISGIDTVSRMSGQVSFTATPQPRVAGGPAAGKLAAAAFLAEAPNLDGDLKEWQGVPGQQIALGQPGEEGSATLRLGWDQKNLYAAFEVRDNSPMVNSGKVLDTLFKYGDSLDLYLACDAQAASDRKEPVPGDVRLLLTRYQGKPLVLAYRARVPGTRNPAVFTSPVGRYLIDVVEPIREARLVFKHSADGQSYVAELMVPLKALAPLVPQAGRKIGFDAGVSFSDAAGQFNAAKVYWTGRQAMVRDIPTEATFNQDQWGRLEFTR